MTHPCNAPLPLEHMVEYLLGERAGAAESAVEEHLFGCPTCTAAMAQLHALTIAIGSQIPPVLSTARKQRLLAGGVRMRETIVPPGEADVHFTRDLDLLIHVLVGDLRDAERVDVELVAVGAGDPLTTLEAVPFDPVAGTVQVACQRHFKGMGFPDDIRFRVIAFRAGASRPVGEYLVRHHWEL